MPGRDGTGPVGQGALTGRGLGPCGTGRTAVGFGRGLGLRRGFGRGYWDYAPQRVVPVTYGPTQTAQVEYTKEQEVEDLKAEKELLEREIKTVEQRIKELK